MKRHAFQKRDDFTCEECYYFRPRDGKPYCSRTDSDIRYNPKCFGCGEFGCDDERKSYEMTLGMFL